MIEVRLLPEAELDMAEAAIFLETRVPGLGEDFTKEINVAIERLRETLGSVQSSPAVFASSWFIAFPKISFIAFYRISVSSWRWRTKPAAGLLANPRLSDGPSLSVASLTMDAP